MASAKWIDHGNYWELAAPQGDQLWLDGRVGRSTTSVSGGLAGKSKFKTPEEQGRIIAGVDREEFTQEAIDRMAHGTRTEPTARNWYSGRIRRNIVERGLIVPKWDLTLGASVDGDIVGTDGIIEIKCPVRMYRPLQEYVDQKMAGWEPPAGYYKHIWPTHYAQIQHAMAVMGKKYCVYIVYCSEDGSVFTQSIPFNQQYWKEHYQVLKENYTEYVAPYLNGKYPITPR